MDHELLYHALTKYAKRTRDFLRLIQFYFSSISYILGSFLAKQLFHSQFLDMWLL